MAKGTTYNHERIEFVDARTGVRLMQVTSFPTMSMALPYFGRNFTGDSKTFIFVSQREARRDAPSDLFRVDTDGTNLTQLTECEGAAGFVMSPQDDCVYFHRQATLWRVDIHTFREEEIAVPHGVASMGAGAISPDGVYYFAQVTTAHDTGGILRIRTDGSEATLIAEGERGGFAMHSVSPGGEGILLWQMREGKKTWLLLDHDGNERGVYTSSYDFAHCTFLGSTERVQGCALPPDRALVQIGLGEEKPTPIAQGVYFWHSASTLDGEWIVSDTNWPDEGLQLVHVPTGRYRPLCYPRSSQGHPQWTHPHPQFSPDGRVVLFNSDRTGICQIYLAFIPDDLRERVRTGQLSVQERRVW
ncbi:MAG: oligogalacturonate lyase family protein [Firmicutes bacterium]|nr:oligogalacturonate lyase family protein [Bacillota bacterium]